jgi:hypothetical protein
VKTLHISSLVRKLVEKEDVMAAAQIRHKLLPIFALVAASILVIAVRSNSSLEQAQKSTAPAPERPTALVEKNERNRMESAAYTDYSRLKNLGEEGKLTSEARRLNRDVTFLTEDSFIVVPMVPVPLAPSLLKESVLAIRGFVEGKQSFLTDSETAIFTEYQVKVSEVFKSDGGIRAGDTVFVTRPGGSVIYEGHILRDLHSRYAPLEANTDCLFFLKKGSAPGAYSLHQAMSIHGEELTTHVASPSGLGSTTLTEALAEVRAAAGGGSKQ